MAKDSDWNLYNQINKRHEGMSALWVSKLSDWLKDHRDLSQLRILDYGCGYFDLGFQLQGHCLGIDGYDPFSSGISLAQKKNQSKSIITDKLSDLPTQAYDMLILNSVVQYMNSQDEFGEFLEKAKDLLKKNSGSTILIADLIPKNYKSVTDALDCISYARQNGYFFPMIKHLVLASVNFQKGTIFQIDQDEVKKIASSKGWSVEVLPTNLTPSKSRYTCRLTWN